MPRILIYWPFGRFRWLLYMLFSLIIIPVYATNLSTVLSLMGFSTALSMAIGLLITLVSLLLSPVHLIVYEAEVEYAPFESITFTIFGKALAPFTIWPRFRRRVMVSLNFGGALIPVAVSIFLTYSILRYAPSLALPLAISIALMSILINRISRFIPAVGIVTPALVPPILAALVSFIFVSFLAHGYLILSPVVAYISGVLGALIGADLLNIRAVIRAAPMIIDIGGAGTFDGIFFTGVMAVFYASLLTLI